MMTLANYGIGSSKHKDPNSTKLLSKCLQIRNRAEILLKQYLKSQHHVGDDKRNEILSAIGNYYSRIPFNVIIWNKYPTKQCIIESVLLLDSKFNPYKAREAFRLVEQMLVNLVYLPWHHEFRRIHTYSGEFRSSISDPLIGIEEVFKAAGFNELSECPMHLYLGDDRMPQVDESESVTSVIFDCMIAQVVFSNIIQVFEDCCRAAKISEDLVKDINCYCWIQAYFRERCHQTTDRACSSIQELLNTITSHLSKLSASNIRSGRSLDKLNINDNPSSDKARSEMSNGAKTTPPSNYDSAVHRVLARDESILKISDDLLKLPTNDEYQNDKLTVSQQRPIVTDSYNTSQIRHRSIFDRFPSRDYVDAGSTNLSYSRLGPSDARSQILQDLPHNDRELLIPRPDRRSTYQSHPTRSAVITKRPMTTTTGMNNDDSDFARGTISAARNTGAGLLGAGRKLDNYSSSHRKYDTREKETKTAPTWTCSSCTYSNRIDSEICDMCRRGR